MISSLLNLLGVKMSRDITDRHIYLSIVVHSFYRKSNEVLLDFASVTSDVKFSLYCLEGYGSSLWDYSSRYVKIYYFAWRKVARRIRSLPYSTHCDTLPIINNTDSVELVLEEKCVKFIWSCLNSSNVVVRSVSLFLLSNKDSIIRNNFRYFSFYIKYIEIFGLA